MNKFCKVAIDAVDLYRSQEKKDLNQAWALAVETNSASKTLGCPWATFITLCAYGFIKGIPRGNYADDLRENRDHALKAMKLLNLEDIKSSYSKTIWDKLDMGVGHNGQIDVIGGLYMNNMLDSSAIDDYKKTVSP